MLARAAEAAAARVPADAAAAKWRRALAARRGLAERVQAFAPHRDRSRPLGWFHAPSVGETLMALPVLRDLRASQHPPQLAITWYSPSAESFARRIDADFHDYLAFDTREAAVRALGALAPTALVYAKLDVWPVLTEEAARKGVKLGLIAASLSSRSSRLGRTARALLTDAYAALDAVGAVGPEDAERLVRLGVRHSAITVTGDTRYDQVWDRVQGIDRTAEPLRKLLSDRPTVVAGSTWPSDEHPLLRAWERVRVRVPGARLIIAPHEPTSAHVGTIRAWGQGIGARTATLGQEAAASAEVVIVDRVGVLAELYAVGTAAFVGGGFHRAGLHSVLEPAALSLPVAFGPNWRSSRDAAGLVAIGAGASKHGPEPLARVFESWLTDRVGSAEIGKRGSAFVRGGLGAAKRTLQVVEHLLS